MNPPNRCQINSQTSHTCEAWLMADLTSRFRQPEWMDEPDLDRAEHIAALRALARINLLSFVSREVYKQDSEAPGPLREGLFVSSMSPAEAET